MKKAELRKYYLHQRSTVNTADFQKLSLGIIEELKVALNWRSLKLIHLFLPIVKQNEIDLWPLIHWIWETHSHIDIVVPKSNFKTREMTSIKLTPDSILSTDNYGIPEPVEGVIISDSNIDLVITPLVVCDKKGYRVGYGKGFYDNFFKQCREDTLRIGVGLFNPVDKLDDIDEWDIPLNQYVNPDGVVNFEN